MGWVSIDCPHFMNGRIQAQSEYLGNNKLSLQAELGRKARAVCSIHHTTEPSNAAHELLPVAWEVSKLSSQQAVK